MPVDESALANSRYAFAQSLSVLRRLRLDRPSHPANRPSRQRHQSEGFAMRIHNRAASALLAATAAFAAIAVAFAGNASAAQTADLAGSCTGRNGTVITLDLEGYTFAGPNTASITLDGSRPSRVSFGTAYNWSSGALDNTVAHSARVVVRSPNRTFTDSISIPACR